MERAPTTPRVRHPPPSPFCYFNPATLNTHSAATVNRHPPITESDYNTVIERPFSTTLGHQFHLRPASEAEVIQAVNRSSSQTRYENGPHSIQIAAKLIYPKRYISMRMEEDSYSTTTRPKLPLFAFVLL